MHLSGVWKTKIHCRRYILQLHPTAKYVFSELVLCLKGSGRLVEAVVAGKNKVGREGGPTYKIVSRTLIRGTRRRERNSIKE